MIAATQLKRYRELQEWDQEELAHRSGLSAKTVSNIECGRHWPRLATLKRIADVLGVPVSKLLAERRRPAAARRKAA